MNHVSSDSAMLLFILITYQFVVKRLEKTLNISEFFKQMFNLFWFAFKESNID